jgi:hypothetical protein
MIKEVRFDIGCENVENMVKFYTEKLGATLLSKMDDFYALELGGVKFALWKAEEDQQGLGVTLVTDDFAKDKATLKKADAIIEEWDDCEMVLVEDPEENALSMLSEQEE